MIKAFQLKDRLKALGLPTTGCKALLQLRLAGREHRVEATLGKTQKNRKLRKLCVVSRIESLELREWPNGSQWFNDEAGMNDNI